MNIRLHTLSALDTVFYDSIVDGDTLSHTSFFRNEAFSYQLALRIDLEKSEQNGWNDVFDLRAEVESDIADAVTLYTIGNVPVSRVGYSTADDWFLRKTPGLYPDCLHTCESGKTVFFAVVGQQTGIWVNINEKVTMLSDGEHTVTIKLYNCRDGSHDFLAESTVVLTVLPAELPKARMVLTNWVHYDCIAHFSQTTPFDDDFYKVAERYIRKAAENGQNMILFPAFTPPLDTPIGEERMTVQLIGVTFANGAYTFDFSEAKRFIELCLSCGMEYFEHSHLYTQWGAEHAPKILVSEDGKTERRFGWETDAHGTEYHEFLHAYLTELKAFLKQNGYEKRFFFHISDEPGDAHLESYRKASDFLHNELRDFPSGDALADYKFYKEGLVQTPIVVTRSAETFLGRAHPLWLYYTGYECDSYLSNRLIGMPKVRGRILGVQLYYVGASGFLNWAFNAHHNRLSRKLVDPHFSADMGSNFVGGTSYLVYPNESDVEPSVRLMTMRDQMQDIRSFEKLEELAGRETVLAIIRKHIPDIGLRCHITDEQLLILRDEINHEIQARSK